MDTTLGIGVTLYCSGENTLSLQAPLNGNRQIMVRLTNGDLTTNKKGDLNFYAKSSFSGPLEPSVECQLKLDSGIKVSYSNTVSIKATGLEGLGTAVGSVRLSGSLNTKPKVDLFGELSTKEVVPLMEGVNEMRFVGFQYAKAKKLTFQKSYDIFQKSYDMALGVKPPSSLSADVSLKVPSGMQAKLANLATNPKGVSSLGFTPPGVRVKPIKGKLKTKFLINKGVSNIEFKAEQDEKRFEGRETYVAVDPNPTNYGNNVDRLYKLSPFPGVGNILFVVLPLVGVVLFVLNFFNKKK